MTLQFSPNTSGVQVEVRVGDTVFHFAPTDYVPPTAATGDVTFLPIIGDPMMRDIVKAALGGALARLEAQS